MNSQITEAPNLNISLHNRNSNLISGSSSSPNEELLKAHEEPIGSDNEDFLTGLKGG